MKTMIFALALISQMAFAHDDGHGPKLGDQPKFGGKVAAVISKKEINAGTDAELLYKAELTKNAQNTVRVYLYNKKMKPLETKDFESATAKLLYKDRKTRKWTSKEFELKKKSGHFEGDLPVKPRRPFNIDMSVKKGEKTLFMAFDNLH